MRSLPIVVALFVSQVGIVSADECDGLLAGLVDRAVVEQSVDTSTMVTDILCESSTTTYSQAKSKSLKIGIVIPDAPPLEFGGSSASSSFSSFKRDMCKDNSTKTQFSSRYKGTFESANNSIAQTFLDCKRTPGLHLGFAPTDVNGTFDVRAIYRPLGSEHPNIKRIDYDDSALRIPGATARVGGVIPGSGVALEVARLRTDGALVTFVLDNDVEESLRIPSAGSAGKAEELAARVAALEARLPAQDATGAFKSVDLDLGTLPLLPNQDAVLPLPSNVPSNAKAVLVYAYVDLGNVNRNVHGFGQFYYEFQTRSAGVMVGRHFLGGFASFSGSHYDFTTNAESFWLPIGSDREIVVRLLREQRIPEWHADGRTPIQFTGVRVIGYQ